MLHRVLNAAWKAKEAAKYLVRQASGEDPLLPPPWLHSIGGGDFKAKGFEFFAYFRELGGLKKTDRVLDIGCGTGRMALPLTTYLQGTYDGMDIVKPSIDWCRKAYRNFPNSRFHFADLSNNEYNRGSVLASAYRFPFPDRSFDFIILTSVFTHMLPRDVGNYLSEIRRMLGGTVFITAFLIDKDTRNLINQGKSSLKFIYERDGYFAEFPDNPEAALAYERKTFVNMVTESGLSIVTTRDGSWRGSEGLSDQDFVIARCAACS